MKKKLNEKQLEAYVGMDARPGPSRMSLAYVEAMLGPEAAKKVGADRASRVKPKAA